MARVAFAPADACGCLDRRAHCIKLQREADMVGGVQIVNHHCLDEGKEEQAQQHERKPVKPDQVPESARSGA